MNRHSTSTYLLGFVTLYASPLLLTACIISSGTGNFGSLSSFTMASTAQTITGTTGFKCIGSLLLILSANIIDAAIVSTVNLLGATPRLYSTTSGTYLPHSIYKDNGRGTVYNVNSTVRWNSTAFLGILDLFNATDGSSPLYPRTATGMTLPAGIYTDIIGLNWARHLYAVSIGPVYVHDDGIANSSVNVTLMVSRDCFVDSAPDLSFGSTTLVSIFIAANQNIDVCCTPNATYTIGFDNGNNFSGGWWRMFSGASTVQYNLYRPGDLTVRATSNTQAGTGNDVTQNVLYRVIINLAQDSALAGTYGDTARIISIC